jgi:hypothetical protein
LLNDPKGALLDLVSKHRPTALILAHPAVSAGVVADVIPDLPASLKQIFLTGRWIERWHPEIATVDAALTAAAWEGPGFGFDPVLTRGYGRVTDGVARVAP